MSPFRSRINAWHLWLALVAFVTGLEVLAPPNQLLSEGVDRALVRRPILVRLAVVVTAGHLLNWWHPAVDPFTYMHRIASRLRRLFFRGTLAGLDRADT
jgi:hypothetical protein